MSRVILSLTSMLGVLSLLLAAAPRAEPTPPAGPTRRAEFTLRAESAPRGGPAPRAAARPPVPGTMFRTSDTCLACHNQLRTPSGEDVSIGAAWRSSMMAHSARDPYWQASVRREVLDRPALQAAIEDECATCHMPMARAHARAEGRTGEVFRHLAVSTGAASVAGAPGAPGAGGAAATPIARLAIDGVSCTLCHQITAEKLGSSDSFTGGFVVDRTRPAGERTVFGPFAIDRGRTTIMRSATGFVPTEAPHLQQSALCATCHTLHTHARGADGTTIARLPEQVPYQEWQHSAYRDERSCQSCHMPEVSTPTPIVAVLGEPRAGLSRHVFRGGNFFVLEMLSRHRAELGVDAPAEALSAAARDTVRHLQTETARIAIADAAVSEGRLLRVDVAVTNLAGHKFPTGYPSRRAWLHVTVRDGEGRALFESGAFRPDGRIAGNDNDEANDQSNGAAADAAADAATDAAALGGARGFEPHYTEIRRADEVQIYESMMVDARGQVTTGLLSGVRFVKDNRLLPRGFDKTTAGEDVAVRGGAVGDADFGAGGDRVRYLIDVGRAAGPFRVEAELWFQPIAFRWAQNLRAYDAAEPRRFVRYYDAMAASSAQRLAGETVTLPQGTIPQGTLP